MKNTRIAPSPTGFFHLGTARTAYHNYLYAKAIGGQFILRIDDTDRERSEDRYVEDIIDNLTWLKIQYDDIFFQSKRQNVYDRYLKSIVNKTFVKDGAVFLNSEEYPVFWTDELSGKIQITETNKNKNVVLKKSNGDFTYHFASVVDDIDMGIGAIIRGTDHITNTASQAAIFNALNNNPPKFFHVGLIHKGKNKGKLSKRDKESDFSQYRKYDVEAVKNFIFKLGWSHPDPNFDKTCPLISMEMAVKIILDGHFKSSPSNVDLDKLLWLNKKYVNMLK